MRNLARSSLVTIAAVLLGSLGPAAPAGAITPTADATALAASALRNTSILGGASFDVAANANATAVATEAIGGFPSAGLDYMVLSSGNATLAPNASQGPMASVASSGGLRGGAQDVVSLRLNITVPASANCLSLNFRFFSEEYPTFVGQGFNDGFLAELDPASAWTMSNHQISAPSNFAFMPGGAFVSINSAPMTSVDAAGTIYGGGTQLLGATTPVTPGAHSLVLSVWDDGDTSLDSAAFIDDIRTFITPAGGCVAGAAPPVADVTPPETTITSAPGGASGPAASFSFASDESGTFECRLDAGAWTPCASPDSLSGLASGSHTFQTRATDDAGNVDPTPASHSWTVDADPPDTALSGGPTGLTRSTSAGFSFAADESDSSFECRLDDGAWASCVSPDELSGLADGSHTYAVRAIDAQGNVDPSPATRTWTVDTVAPETTITATPPTTSGATATFAFATEESDATFECRLDDGDWAPCTSPQQLTGLADGPHTYSVRASDAQGNVDQTPASHAWTVDTTAPDTTITDGPSGATGVASASFTFGSGDEGATFECRLDEGEWTACASPHSLTGLADGPHTYSVRASDARGNTDATPATRAWTVDTGAPAAPVVTVTTAPAAASNDPQPTITFGGEPGASFECRLDGGAWSACMSPSPLSGLADGTHTFEIRQTDAAGNLSGVASHTWTVDTAAPASPSVLSGPPAATEDKHAAFALAAEPGAALECRLDDGDWHACGTSVDVSRLSVGTHRLQVRQTDAAGNVSPIAERTWKVKARAVPVEPATEPQTFAGSVGTGSDGRGGSRAIVDGGRVAAGCGLAQGRISRCTVVVRRNSRVVGRGTATYGKDGVRVGRVEVRLNPAMRARLAGADRDVRVTFSFIAKAVGRPAPMTSEQTVDLVASRALIIPGDGLFETARAEILPKGLAYLRAVRGSLRSAKVIRCVGHTDSVGTSIDNERLGLRRAKAVCRELRRLGVQARLAPSSAGETRPRSTNATEAGRADNRRVELEIRR